MLPAKRIVNNYRHLAYELEINEVSLILNGSKVKLCVF